MKDMYKEEATRIVKTLLLMKSIAKKESIAVDKAEIEDYVKNIAKQRGQDYEAAKESYESEGLIDQIEVDLLNQKVFEYIESKAEISIVEPAAEPAQKEEKP